MKTLHTLCVVTVVSDQTAGRWLEALLCYLNEKLNAMGNTLCASVIENSRCMMEVNHESKNRMLIMHKIQMK